MSRRRTGPGTVHTRAGGEPPLMRVVQHEEPERVGPLRQRTAEHHQRRRFGPDGRVVEEHQAIRYIDDYAPPTGSRELRLLAVHWAALIAFFLTTLLAGAYWGGWAALAAGLAWVLVLGRESVLILLAYGATAAVVSVLLQSFWGAVILAAPGPWSGSRASQGSRSACGGGMPTTTGGVSG